METGGKTGVHIIVVCCNRCVINNIDMKGISNKEGNMIRLDSYQDGKNFIITNIEFT